MTIRHPAVHLLLGHASEVLRDLPENHFHAVVTSPPYWGLRSYGTDPVIWGGTPGHEHEWFVMDGRANRHHAEGLPAWGAAFAAGGAHKNASTTTVAMPYARCNCGAVRCELGHERSPDEFVAHLVSVFREVRRVLRDDGTCWVVIGDCYARDAGTNHPTRSNSHGQWFDVRGQQRASAARESAGFGRPPDGMKHKDLVGIPWMFAFAMRADGWWLRRPIIWEKQNVLPESVDDRPTVSYETVFLFAKSESYFYDKYAVLEPNQMRPPRRTNGHKRRQPMGAMPGRKWQGTARGELAVDGYPEGRNLRDVWSIPTKPFSGRDYVADLIDDHPLDPALHPDTEPASKSIPIGPLIANPSCGLHGHLSSWRWDLMQGSASALGPSNPPCSCVRVNADHFAVFPPRLAAIPIRAGSSAGGCCKECGAPRVRVIEKRQAMPGREDVSTGNETVRADGGTREADAGGAGGNVMATKRSGTRWFTASCLCGTPGYPTLPCRILDPFGGSGTTALAGGLLGRDVTLIDRRSDYVVIQAGRIAEAGLKVHLPGGAKISDHRRARALTALAKHDLVDGKTAAEAGGPTHADTTDLFQDG